MARTTAERIEFLMGLRDKVEDNLALMLASPKPTYNVDGQMFDFTEYQDMLFKSLRNLTDLIVELDTINSSGSLARTQVFTGG